jgi:hypothetical protein
MMVTPRGAKAIRSYTWLFFKNDLPSSVLISIGFSSSLQRRIILIEKDHRISLFYFFIYFAVANFTAFNLSPKFNPCRLSDLPNLSEPDASRIQIISHFC